MIVVSLTPEESAPLEALAAANEVSDFWGLIQRCGLDPAKDFEGIDLSEVDFGSVPKGIEFVGAIGARPPDFDMDIVIKDILEGREPREDWIPWIRSLDFRAQNIKDLAPLSRLAWLEKLNLRGVDVVDLTPLSGGKIWNWEGFKKFEITENVEKYLEKLYRDQLIVSKSDYFKKIIQFNYSDNKFLDSIDKKIDSKPPNFNEILHVYYENKESLLPLALIKLKTLQLSQSGVTDLTPLSALEGLEELNLDRTQVTDVAPLSGLKSLRTLILSRTQVVDLSPLKALIRLKTLFLTFTPVAELKGLEQLVGLSNLSLNGTQVSDLRPLSGMTGLRTLRLGKSFVKNLSPLAGLQRLEFLNLVETKVSDLSPLSDLTSLRNLDITGTMVTDLRPLEGLDGLEVLAVGDRERFDLSPLSHLIARGLQIV